MKADTSLRADYPPRCLIIATAERMPEGHSTMARLFSVPVEGGAVNLEVLTRLQNQTAHLNQALAGCIQWLLSHAERLREGLRARFVYYRTRAQRDGGHKREPAQIAHLMLGLETFLDFAVAHAAMTAEARVAWLEEAWTALRLIAREHGAQLEDQKPVARFLAILADGFASKAAYLEAKDGGDPEEARLWGWETLSYMRDGEECYRNQHPARAINLGRVDKDYLYLLPEATYQFLATAARAAGQTFPVEPKTLLRRLEEAQVIETRKDLNGNMNRVLPVRFGRTTLRVIKLYRTAFEGQGESVTSVTCVTSVTSQTRKTPQENDTREANPCASQHPLYNPPPIKQTLHTSQASQTLHDAPVIDLTGEA